MESLLIRRVKAYLFFSALLCSPLDSDMVNDGKGREFGLVISVVVAVNMIQIFRRYDDLIS